MRRELWTALLILGIVSTAVSSAEGQSLETIDFDDHPANPQGTPGIFLDPDFYADRGVRFSIGATVLAYEPGFTPSGSNGLEMCYAAEFCSTPFSASFDSPQTTVSVAIGYSDALNIDASVVMVAYDANGSAVDFDTASLGPGAPVPVATQLSVGPVEPRVAAAQESDGLITMIEIMWADEARAMNSLAIDNLVYEPFVPFLAFFVEPAVLRFGSPAEAREVLVTNVGNVIAVLDLTLEGDTEAFVLDDSACGDELAPGSSCSVSVRFNPPADGEYLAEIVIVSPQLEQNQVVPIDGILSPQGGTTETTDAGGDDNGATDSEATDDVSDATIADESSESEAESRNEPTEEATPEPGTTDDGQSPLMTPMAIVAVLIAIGGGALLLRLRPGRHGPGRADTNSPRAQATVRVSPDQGTSQVTTDQQQPVTAIRVKADSGTTTTKENRP